MNNLLSYYGLIDVRMRASDKDLPVRFSITSGLVIILRQLRQTYIAMQCMI